MKPATVERLFVIWIGVALTLWAACLTVAWAWAMDSSGTSTLVTISATFMALAVAAGLPGQVARAMRRLLVRLDVQEAADIRLAATGAGLQGRDAGRAITRLLAASAALAMIGGLVTTAGVYGVSAMIDACAGRFLWSNPAWLVAKFIIQFLCMLPLALGISVTFLVGAMIRVGPAKDLYAAIWRDWHWAVAIAAAIFAVAWWAGVDMLAMAMLMAPALMAVSIVLAGRVKIAHRARRLVRPIVISSQRGRMAAIVLCYGAGAIVLILQMRLLTDAAGLSTAAKACWLAASIAMLTTSLGRADRRNKPYGQTAATAAVVGAIAICMTQTMLAAAHVRAGLAGSYTLANVCGALAAALQLPLTALGAIFLTRQRRLYASDGGRARSYLACAAAGISAGVMVFVVVASLGIGRFVLTGIALVVLTGGLLSAISHVKNARHYARWGMCAAVLLCSLSAATLTAVSKIATQLVPGAWLTTGLPVGNDPQRRSELVTAELARNILASPQHSWWTVVGSPHDIPPLLDQIPTGAQAWPDPRAVSIGEISRATVGGLAGDFLAAARVGVGRFDRILLAPAPVDHPMAWRLYSRRVLRQCARRLEPGGVLLIRTQVSSARPASVIAVARGLHQAVGPGWLAAARVGDRWDILMCASRDAIAAPAPAGEMHVVRLDQLLRRWPNIGPVRIIRPMDRHTRAVDGERFEMFLRESSDHFPISRPAAAAR